MSGSESIFPVEDLHTNPTNRGTEVTTTLIDERVKQLNNLTLQHGSHSADDAGRAMCAMEAVAWIAGEPHSDHPQCASPAIAAFMRSWNDGLNDADRDRLLKPFLVRLVGSRGTPEQEERRGLMALDWHNGVMLPAFLELVDELKPQAEAVRADHLNPDVIRKARMEARAAWDAARDAAWDAAGDAAGDAAWAAARVAAWAAAGAAARVAAWDAAGDAAWDAAWVAAWDAAGDAAGAAARDALAPVVTELQASALDLLDRMLKVTEASA